jgi:hypothetical protein
LLSEADAILSPVPRTPGIFSNWSIARWLPASPPFTIRLAIAARAGTLRDRPSSRTGINWSNISWIRVTRFFEPLGRPFRLPDWPLGNCVSFGGFPYPTLYSPGSVSESAVGDADGLSDEGTGACRERTR